MKKCKEVTRESERRRECEAPKQGIGDTMRMQKPADKKGSACLPFLSALLAFASLRFVASKEGEEGRTEGAVRVRVGDE